MVARACAILLVALSSASVGAQTPAAAAPLSTHIRNLSAFDYPTRTNAARLIRRAPVQEAVPALTEAVRRDPDQFVRYRALVLLTSFNDRGTPDLMRSLLGDRNDRVRELAYKWLEANPDGRLIDTLLGSLQTEQAEFVRPALVAALAALGSNPNVQRALLGQVSRGLDFFRSAVIDALGRHRATYAVDAIAEVAKLEGPLQDDAVLALGRIGGAKASGALATIPKPAPEVVPTIRAAQCLLDEACDAAIKAFSADATRGGTATAVVRASIGALGDLAGSGHKGATDALAALGLSAPNLRAQVALAFAAAAVRSPSHVLGWLDAAPATTREGVIELLKEGFEDLEEDFGEEMFFATTRATYWKADEKSPTRMLSATLIQKLEF
jgi:HEAT repeat protein